MREGNEKSERAERERGKGEMTGNGRVSFDAVASFNLANGEGEGDE